MNCLSGSPFVSSPLLCKTPLRLGRLNTYSRPNVILVGLPDAAVKESIDRVRAALINSGLTYPRGHLTINLGPADLRKEGLSYDLPIAAAL